MNKWESLTLRSAEGGRGVPENQEEEEDGPEVISNICKICVFSCRPRQGFTSFCQQQHSGGLLMVIRPRLSVCRRASVRASE